MIWLVREFLSCHRLLVVRMDTLTPGGRKETLSSTTSSSLTALGKLIHSSSRFQFNLRRFFFIFFHRRRLSSLPLYIHSPTSYSLLLAHPLLRIQSFCLMEIILRNTCFQSKECFSLFPFIVGYNNASSIEQILGSTREVLAKKDSQYKCL